MFCACLLIHLFKKWHLTPQQGSKIEGAKRVSLERLLSCRKLLGHALCRSRGGNEHFLDCLASLGASPVLVFVFRGLGRQGLQTDPRRLIRHHKT